MLPENKIVRGVWIGDRLSPIQRLCIKSFQEHGHEFHLYYGYDVGARGEGPVGMPIDTIPHLIDEIVPLTDRRKFNCDSHFSDWFRVNLIYRTGGWYTDMDEVCLEPFDFPEPYVFVSEYPAWQINGCIFKAPAGSQLMRAIILEIASVDRRSAQWCEVGPDMFRRFVPEFQLQKYVKGPEVFDGLSPEHLARFVGNSSYFGEAHDPHSLHLRSSYWKTEELNPFKVYPVGSYFETLKRLYGVTNV